MYRYNGEGASTRVLWFNIDVHGQGSVAAKVFSSQIAQTAQCLNVDCCASSFFPLRRLSACAETVVFLYYIACFILLLFSSAIEFNNVCGEI